MSTVFSATPTSRKVAQPDHILAYTRAKVALMLKPDTVFFTSVLFSLPQKWSEEIPTACTDGTCITYNPHFFLSLSQEERVFLMLHEALHVALMHMDRLGERNRKLWNYAADHVINLMLKAKGFQMPKDGLVDDRFKDMGSEQVYAVLLAEQTTGGEGQQPGNGPGNFGGDLQTPQGDMNVVREQVNDILVRAATRAKMENNTPGSIPGQFQVYLDKLLNPKLPWNRILQKYLHALAKNDFTFKKPNRRFFPQHILPSIHSEGLMDIAVAVDTSGSVTDAEFTRFVSEIAGIFRMLKPQRITVVQFDTQIKSTHEVRSLRELKAVHFTGRGGTKIAPVLEWANQHKPQLLLVFSDGEFRWPGDTTKRPVIWLIHNNPSFAAPFGKTIHYEAQT